MPDTKINRIRQYVASAPGTGSAVIGAAVDAFKALGSGQNGQTFSVLFVDGTAWEIATGCAYTHGTTTLTRGTLEDSSSGSRITLSADTVVTITSPASEGDYWDAGAALATTALQASNNLSDLASAATARGNLGLGTAATTASSAYATAAQGATADSAAQIAGDLAGTAAAPVVAKINGVAVTGTPTAGQVPTATSGTAATWQTPSGGSYEVATFADLPDPTTVTAGRVYTVLAAVVSGGTVGTQWVSDGTKWKPAGQQTLWQSTSASAGVSGGTTSEQILRQFLLPANLLIGCNSVIAYARGISSGSADSGARTLRWRLGTGGTTSDAQLLSASMTAANRQYQLYAAFAAHNTTTLRAIGLQIQVAAAALYVAGGTNNAELDTTISATTNALYLSFSMQQSGTVADTVSASYTSLVVG